MATVIRAPRVGEPKRIGVAVRREAQRDPPMSQGGTEATAAEVGFSESLIACDGPQEAASGTDIRPAQARLEAELEQARRQLQHAIERAEAAEQGLESIKLQLEVLKEEARQQGYTQGQQEGKREGLSELETAAASLLKLAGSVEHEARNLLLQKEDELVEVTYAAVTRILGEGFATESGVRQAVVQVLRMVSQRDALVIRVSPHDHSLLVRSSGELLKETQATALEIVPDERVELGGCILETAVGSLDGRLEVQLDNLKQALMLAWERQRVAER